MMTRRCRRSATAATTFLAQGDDDPRALTPSRGMRWGPGSAKSLTRGVGGWGGSCPLVSA